MAYRVIWAAEAFKALRRLSPQIRERALAEASALADNPRPPRCLHLKGKPRGRWRVRFAADWRLILSHLRLGIARGRRDKARLQARSHDLLSQVASVIQANPSILKVEVQGHTDDRASARYNKALSQRRVQSVVDFLVSRGVDRGRLVPVGYGEVKAIDTNATDEGRAKNRRVEFVIVARGAR